MPRYNADEQYIQQLASSIPRVNARFATSEEDGGYHKADVILTYEGETYRFQVSRTPKSKKQRRNLSRRGTHPIHTHRFGELRVSDESLVKTIKEILKHQPS